MFGDLARPAEKAMRRPRRSSPPVARLAVLLLATGLVGAFALLGGWALGAAVGGGPGEGAAATRLPPVALDLLGRGPGPLQSFVPPQATPTPAPTPTPVPPPEPTPVLATRRLVTYYGNPLADVLGVLREAPAPPLLDRLPHHSPPYPA